VKLPADNTLALPATNDDLVLDRSDRLIPSLENIVALLPTWARELDSPVRDALAAAWRAMANVLWARFGQVLARLYTPRYAAGAWLDEWGRMLKRPRAAPELDAPYRARLLSQPARLTPTAIRAALEALYAETGSGTVRPQLMEPLTDFVFCADPSPDAAWSAFVQGRDRRLWALYPDNPNPAVGVFVAYATPRAEFWVLCPGTALVDLTTAFALAVAGPLTFDFAAAVAPLWVDADLRFVESSEPLLDRVIWEVESRRAFGVRWGLLVDPNLEGAA
jgi:hypothetical protein